MREPDTYEMYLIFGWADGNLGYETGSEQYMGHIGYSCSGTWIPSDYQQSTPYLQCYSHFNGDCPCAYHTVGNSACQWH